MIPGAKIKKWYGDERNFFLPQEFFTLSNKNVFLTARKKILCEENKFLWHEKKCFVNVSKNDSGHQKTFLWVNVDQLSFTAEFNSPWPLINSISQLRGSTLLSPTVRNSFLTSDKSVLNAISYKNIFRTKTFYADELNNFLVLGDVI